MGKDRQSAAANHFIVVIADYGDDQVEVVRYTSDLAKVRTLFYGLTKTGDGRSALVTLIEVRRAGGRVEAGCMSRELPCAGTEGHAVLALGTGRAPRLGFLDRARNWLKGLTGRVA